MSIGGGKAAVTVSSRTSAAGGIQAQRDAGSALGSQRFAQDAGNLRDHCFGIGGETQGGEQLAHKGAAPAVEFIVELTGYPTVLPQAEA